MAVLRMTGLCIHYALRSRMHLPPSVLQQGPNARIVKTVPKTTTSRQSLDWKGTHCETIARKVDDDEARRVRTTLRFQDAAGLDNADRSRDAGNCRRLRPG